MNQVLRRAWLVVGLPVVCLGILVCTLTAGGCDLDSGNTVTFEFQLTNSTSAPAHIWLDTVGPSGFNEATRVLAGLTAVVTTQTTAPHSFTAHAGRDGVEIADPITVDVGSRPDETSTGVSVRITFDGAELTQSEPIWQ